MALRGLLAEIRAQQHSSVRLHFRRVATSKSPGLDSSEFRVPVPWGFIAGQGEHSMLIIKVIRHCIRTWKGLRLLLLFLVRILA